MNREIKFRAWFKPLKRMYKVSDLKFQRNGDIIVITNHTGGTYPVAYEIMQFTGLHDKNSKEIYEGDILEVVNTARDNQSFQGEVFFSDDFHCWELLILPKTKDETQVGFDQISWRQLEVVGNIYDKPSKTQESKESNKGRKKNVA